MATLLEKQQKREAERLAEEKAAKEEDRPIDIPILDSKEYQEELKMIARTIIDKSNASSIEKVGYFNYAKSINKIIQEQTGRKQMKEIKLLTEKYEGGGYKKEILKDIRKGIKSSKCLTGPAA